MTRFWSLTYKIEPVEGYEDGLLQSIMLKGYKENGREYQHACCVEGGDWPETPEGFMVFMNRQFPDHPVRFVLVDKREITEEEYLTQHLDKERRAQREVDRIRGKLKENDA